MDSAFVSIHSLQGQNFFNTEVISMIIAILAVIIGPITSLKISSKTLKTQEELHKSQIKSQNEISHNDIKTKVLSANRQQWINKLRSNLSEFLANCLIYSTKSFNDDKRLLISERIFTLSFEIELHLNPKESEHQELVELLNEMMNVFIFNEEGDERNLKEEILSLSKIILKTEWERVKTLA